MFITDHLTQILLSVGIILFFLVMRMLLAGFVRRFARNSDFLDHRTGLVLKHVSLLTLTLIILSLAIVWGFEFKDLGILMSSVFALIGVGFIAQWSILSNITSGLIMFFTFPYKIGDYIIIHDKEFAKEGIITDIKSFHVILTTKENEIVTYPNTLMLQKGVTVIKPTEFEAMDIELEEDKNVKEQPID